MPIFANEEQQPGAGHSGSTPSTASGRSTQIAAGTKVVGEITGTTEVVIEGQFEGKIRVNSNVFVGKDGKVTGEVHAQTISIAGTVHGDMQGKERLDVQSSGSVEGDVVAPRVVIANGAFFKGGVEMTDAAPVGKAPAKAQAGGK